jgi:hypothetical protein
MSWFNQVASARAEKTNSTHRVNVIRIDEILPHPTQVRDYPDDTNKLGIVYVGGYQCVVSLKEYKVGDLALYIQPDTIVPPTDPFKFLWADREFADGTIPEKLRRITVRRFRKEWSEGLLMPISAFGTQVDADVAFLNSGHTMREGEDVAALLGFKHYVEPEPVANINAKQQYKGWPKSAKGWFYYILEVLHIYKQVTYGSDQTKPPKQFCPVYDVEALKNYPRTFAEDENVFVTEKLHGSNARYIFTSADQKMHVGSHNYWKSEASTCIWRRALKEFPWIEQFCREFPDHVLYGEILPTQTGYRYGCAKDEIKFRAFDVLKPDGTYVDKQQLYGMGPLGLGQNLVPLLYVGQWGTGESIKALAQGKSKLDSSHLLEGIVISSAVERVVRGLGRAQLKLKSMAFMEKEGKNK